MGKKEIVHINKDTEVVLLKKEDRNCSKEWFLAPAKKGKTEKNGNKAAEVDLPKKPIKHNAETFQLFGEVDKNMQKLRYGNLSEEEEIKAPVTVADIPPILEKLQAQMELYNAKIQD